MPAILSITNLQKRFPGVQALGGVDFTLLPGEIHALMGENGAGKSTMIKVMTGVHRRDAGEIKLDGHAIQPRSPADAEALGISTVFQEINLIPGMSVAENILLGRLPRRSWKGFHSIDWAATRRSAEAALKQLGLAIDVRRTLESLPIAVQQMVAIARAIAVDAKVLVLDEPTSSLDEKEVEELFSVMNRLRDNGVAIVFVTHFLDQVYRISDRITVLRNGTTVGAWNTHQLPRVELIQHMLGKAIAAQKNSAGDSNVEEIPHAHRAETPNEAAAIIAANGLGRHGSIAPFDLEISAGQSVGLAGLLGSGRSEIARLIAGLDRATSGTLTVAGNLTARWSTRTAIDSGIVYCPEDRKLDGVILQLSVRENILLGLQAARSVLSPLPMAEQIEIAKTYVDRLSIKTPSLEIPVGTLSGGNQQKVLLARWLAMKPKLIVMDEPTRGIDVGAKAEIEHLIDELQRSGVAILLISSELEDLVRCCQRVVVLRDRHVVGELPEGQIDTTTIIQMIAKHDPSEAATA